MAPPIVIGTSVAPGARLEIQRAALRSWLDNGFRVVSFNTNEESGALAPAFPGVEFAPPPRTAEALIGKPLVYVSDILAGLAALGAPVVGIANSDIYFPAAEGLTERLAKAGADALLLGSRLEVGDFAEEEGTPDPFGFDYFFLPAERAGAIPPASFMLGMPMWDYWLPLATLAAGLPARRIEPPLGRHLPQEAGWADNIFIFGKLLVEQLWDLARRHDGAAGMARGAAEMLASEQNKLHEQARAAQAAGDPDEAYAYLEALAKLYDQASRTIFRHVTRQARPFDWRG